MMIDKNVLVRFMSRYGGGSGLSHEDTELLLSFFGCSQGMPIDVDKFLRNVRISEVAHQAVDFWAEHQVEERPGHEAIQAQPNIWNTNMNEPSQSEQPDQSEPSTRRRRAKSANAKAKLQSQVRLGVPARLLASNANQISASSKKLHSNRSRRERQYKFETDEYYFLNKY